jgi:hypothetical protein
MVKYTLQQLLSLIKDGKSVFLYYIKMMTKANIVDVRKSMSEREDIEADVLKFLIDSLAERETAIVEEDVRIKEEKDKKEAKDAKDNRLREIAHLKSEEKVLKKQLEDCQKKLSETQNLNNEQGKWAHLATCKEDVIQSLEDTHVISGTAKDLMKAVKKIYFCKTHEALFATTEEILSSCVPTQTK